MNFLPYNPHYSNFVIFVNFVNFGLFRLDKEGEEEENTPMSEFSEFDALPASPAQSDESTVPPASPAQTESKKGAPPSQNQINQRLTLFVAATPEIKKGKFLYADIVEATETILKQVQESTDPWQLSRSRRQAHRQLSNGGQATISVNSLGHWQANGDTDTFRGEISLPDPDNSDDQLIMSLGSWQRKSGRNVHTIFERVRDGRVIDSFEAQSKR